MTEQQRDAIRAVSAVLERENAALRAQDYAALVPLGEAKRDALARLDALVPTPPALLDGEEVLVGGLRAATVENRRLLRQGMAVQHRIMGLLAGAARKATEAAGYGASGVPGARTTPAAVALLAQA